MPTPYIKKLAKKHHTSVGKSEGRWEKAKQQTAKQGHSEDFAYITGIYKKMMGEDVSEMSLKQFLQITEMDDVSDIGYGSPTDEEEPCDDEFCDDELDLDLEDDLDSEEGHELVDVLSPEELDDEEGDIDGEMGDEEFPEDEFGDEEFPEEDDSEFEFREGVGHTTKAKLIRQVNKSSKKLAKVRKNSGFDDLPKGQAKEQKRVVKGLNNLGVKNLTTKLYKEDEDFSSPMSFLNELMVLDESKSKKKPMKKAAKAVYHRDYVKTKNKPYRKYDPSERGEKD